MQYRNLGRTGVKVSPLCIGTGSFAGLSDPAFDALLGRAVDHGLNFLDTANIYGGRGRDERKIGSAVKRLGCRDRLVLATKVEGPMDETDPNGRGISRRHIIRQCEESLRRLQTDYIDLYQLHCSHGRQIPVDEPLRALDDLIRAGKVRYCGTSHYSAWQLMESLWVSRELGCNRFVCEQAVYHPLDRTIERELLPFALTYGHGIILWSPLASGFLTGKYSQSDKKTPLDTVLRDLRDKGHAEEVQRSVSQAFRVVGVIRDIARRKDCTPAQFTLAWELAREGITAPIVGFRNKKQLEENIGALNITVTGEDREEVDRVARPRMAVVPYNDAGGTPPLNSDWGPHRYRW